MSEAIPTGTTRLHTLAVVLSSLVIVLPMLVGGFVKAALDSSNPAKVDITQDLAYLREILISSFGSVAVLLVVIVVIYILLWRRSGSFIPVRLPLLILVVQLVVGILLLVTNGIATSAGDSYAALGALGSGE